MKSQFRSITLIASLCVCFLAAAVFCFRQSLPAASSAAADAASAAPLPVAPAVADSPTPDATREFPLRSLQRINLKIGSHTLRVWVMDTDAKREEGMMFLKDKQVKADEGMLFVFPYADSLSFWMKNTLIPLDIAYLGSDKRIIHMAQMNALDETPVPSNGPAQYALELKWGTLKKLAARDGMLVAFPKVTAQAPPPPSLFAPASPFAPTAP